MRIVVCYDVVKDRRRGKLHRRLKEVLFPVQKSVFEGDVDRKGLAAVEEIVNRTIQHDTDTVRIYVLCGSCAGSERLLGTSTTIPSPSTPVIFT